MERDASTATWLKAVDRVFSNKYTVTDSLLGAGFVGREEELFRQTVPQGL